RIEDKLETYDTCHIESTEQVGVPDGPKPPMVQLLIDLLNIPMATNELLFRAPGRRHEILDALLQLDQAGRLKFTGHSTAFDRIQPLETPIELSESKSVVRNFNECFQQLQAAAERQNATATMNTTLDTFLRFYGYAPLFNGVAFNAAGLLDEHGLLKNLGQLELETERVSYLERALHELLHFTLFAARDYLDRDEIRQMQQSLSNTTQAQLRSP
ncbi:MAG: hypothetical protein VX589_11690, partial [Myxococcota bacterium]|nr:hypothetical protein [Myxococcota bacterium]